MAAVTVRAAGVLDAPVVGGLLDDFNTEFDCESPGAGAFATRFTSLLQRTDQVVLLAESEQSGEPVGFAYLTLRATVYYDGPLAQLEELYVRPAWRGRGTGTALMDAAITLVRERGAGGMSINVDEVDTEARRFYEQRFGFVNIAPGTDYRMLYYERDL